MEDEDSDPSNMEPPSRSRKKQANGSRDDNVDMPDVDDVGTEHASDDDEV